MAPRFDLPDCSGSLPALKGPDRLVGVGFRCWMAGYQTGDISCWEMAWDTYAASLGAATARGVVSDLACWVRSVKDASQRTIEVFPGGCERFCRDECMAVSLIAACQHDVCPALSVCLASLVGKGCPGRALEDARCFARTLRSAGQILSPERALPPVTCPVVAAGSTRCH